MSLWGKSTSVWLDTTPSTDYEALAAELTVDVAVAGGGIAGLVTAYFLSQQGLKVAVVEALRIVQDVTGYTLGKITSEHGQRYGLLARTLGQEKAQVYADANMAALERTISIIQSNGIDCDFKRADAFLYT
ncbi:MAG: FAD-binding oxidoreductase, partial [Actinomycetota bacterium]